jgi:hypothetical protein
MNSDAIHQKSLDKSKAEKLIITGASKTFGASLLALLGSLTLNWPEHPPVLVYDLGMDEETLAILNENRIEVRKIPPFVPHWRKHFTWKIWCWNDAPARDILWLDAGLIVLQPADEIFDAIDRLGYFINPTYYLLSDTATDAACIGCGVDLEFRNNRITFNGGVIGFRKEDIFSKIIAQSLAIASVEEYIQSTIPLGRHDQAIVSLLIHKYISNPIMLDTMIYAGWLSPHQVHGQKIWQHRRTLLQEDLDHFKKHISTPGLAYVPNGSLMDIKKDNMSIRIRRLLKKSPAEIFTLIHSRLTKKTIETKIYDGVRD